MKLRELKDSLREFEKTPSQAHLSVVRSQINESFLKKEIKEETKDSLLKELYASATMAGLFVLQIKNMEYKSLESEEEEDEEYEEESYEESYSYEDEEEEEEDFEDEEPQHSYD